MKILLPIKRVVDYHVAVQVKPDRQGVDIEHAKKSMNPFDAIAVEQAIQLKEQDNSIELVAVSIGSEASTETLRQALAMGVDRAQLICTNDTLEPIHIAKILQHICSKEQPDLVICGKQAIDNDCNQSGQMLSALLGWPQGCFISSLDFEDKNVQVRCETDDGLETLQLTLPCVLTTDLRLNEPRFAKLPDIIKAKQKPLEHIALDSLPIKIRAHQEIIEYMPPSTRPPGQQLDNVDELIAILKKNEVLT